MAMALPFGKLTILIGAGLVGSVLAKDGSLPVVSSLVSGAFKIVFKQLKQEEPSKPRNDTALVAQVNSLRHELQLLASNRPIAIVTTEGSDSLEFSDFLILEISLETLYLQFPFLHQTLVILCLLLIATWKKLAYSFLPFAGRKYGVIIIIGVVGYGYVWWKGWKLPDFMFATRRSLSDACNNVGNQIDGFYSTLSDTKRELGSEVDRMDCTLDASSVIIKETGREVAELRDGTANMKDEARSVFEAMETLASKVNRIEGNQDLTLKGVGALHAQCREHKRLQESNKALLSSSSLPAIEAAPLTHSSSETLSLPPASRRESQSPSTPNGAQQSHGPLQHTQSMSGLKDISESSSSLETLSNGTYSGKTTGNGASGSSSGLVGRLSMPRIVRTISAVINTVPTN